MLRAQLEKVFSHRDLEKDEMRSAMETIMDGKAPEAQVAAFLAALRSKGETTSEIAEAAEVMREKATPVKVTAAPLIDIVGTGGDGTGTFNISTASAIIVAAAGVSVAKHGNRSVSSSCGSADILEALGIPLLSSSKAVASCIDETGFGFIFAPHFHRAMKNVVPVRRAMGTRTIFNLLGPLTNPARPDCQLMGVFSPHLIRPMAEVLKKMGLRRAMVVHGHGGMDELSLSGPNKVCILKDSVIEERQIVPEDAGLYLAEPGYAQGGDAVRNREIIEEILAGVRGPHREVVILNSAAALFIAGRVKSLRKGALMAEEIIESGLAAAKAREIKTFALSREVIA